MKPIVSIILPTYNWKAGWLSESIDSVLNQTFKDFELIIINDASTNDIEKTIKEYEKKDSRIVYLKNEKNLKLTKTLNKWIKSSKWKYIARIDDDDIRTTKDKLEKQVKFMEDNQDYWLCWAWVVVTINEEGEELYRTNTRLSDSEVRKHFLQSNQFAHSSVMIRKSILDEVWIYNPDYNKAEDYELWCRVWIKSKFTNIKNIGINYRINSKWVTRKNFFYQKKLTFKICLKYRKYYPNIYKAIIFRFWDFIIPEKIKDFIFKFFKK